MDELKKRLIDRKTEQNETLQKRLDLAAEEMTKINQYDYLIVNDELEAAYQILRSIIIAESYRIKK